MSNRSCKRPCVCVCVCVCVYALVFEVFGSGKWSRAFAPVYVCVCNLPTCFCGRVLGSVCRCMSACDYVCSHASFCLCAVFVSSVCINA